VFEFLGVLISVILGLALTHLLRGLAKVIHMRRTAKPYWVHIVWTFNTLLYVLALWWGMSSWNALRSWTIEWYLFIAGYVSVMFMLASMLYPPDFADDLDCEGFFFANKGWFFGLLVVALLLDIPETLAKGVAHCAMFRSSTRYFCRRCCCGRCSAWCRKIAGCTPRCACCSC
jgi:hypothetical protein